jgi:hypothetical protein
MQKRYSRAVALPCLCFLTIVFTIPVITFGQDAVPTTKTYIKLGENFLHALYPELNDKKYTITVETSFRYDDPTDIPRVFTLDVGAGPKSLVISCCFGGYAGGSLPPFKIPDPQEWPPPPPPPCPPAPSCPLFTTPHYPMRPKNVDAQGQLRPEQFLTVGFSFDVNGRLVAFNAHGAVTANHDSDNQLYEALRARLIPTLSPTDAEITNLLKQSGAKYGYKDQKQFRDELPLKKIEKFIGKVEVLSLDFSPIDPGWNSDPVNEVGVWSYVTVLMRAVQPDGTKLNYRAVFDHFAGALTSLHELPDEPNQIQRRAIKSR